MGTRKRMAPLLDADYLVEMYKIYVYEKPIIPTVVGLLSPSEKERLEFDLEFRHGFFTTPFVSGAVPHEFIADLSQHYVKGSKYFFRMYGRYFSRQQVEQFYNFVRDDIFRGKEY